MVPPIAAPSPTVAIPSIPRRVVVWSWVFMRVSLLSAGGGAPHRSGVCRGRVIRDAVVDGPKLGERPGGRGAERRGQALERTRQDGKADVVAMVVCDRRQPQWVRHTSAVRLAV